MKKIFGLVMASENIELIFAVNQCLYKKISNMVGNFYILNLIHFMNNGFNSKKLMLKTISYQIILKLLHLRI